MNNCDMFQSHSLNCSSMLFATVLVLFIGLTSGLVLPLNPINLGRIVGGSPANIAEAPYQAALLLDYWSTGNFVHACGGTLISRRAVLTAAQCIHNTQSNQWNTRLSSSLHDATGTVVLTFTMIEHPGFQPQTLENDIAIITLIAEIPMTTATLPSIGQTVADGAIAFVTGWGILNEGGTKPKQLFKVNIPVVNQQQCLDAYSTFNPVTENMICAGNMESGNQGACIGDVGGPMVVNGFLFGITSWSDGCGKQGLPNVFTRVPSYRSWINQTCASCVQIIN